MADEPAQGKPTEPNVDETAAALTAARELLIANGDQVLAPSAFHGIKTAAAAQAEAKYAESQVALEAAQTEMAKLAEYKARIENKDKSDGELHAEQRRAWQAKDAETSAAIEAANAQLVDAHAALAAERVHNRIAALMPGATNAEAAQMWAEKHIGKMLSTDDDGQLVWTDPTGTPHIGIAAEKNVSDWWSMDGQKFLHAGNTPGPDTGGAKAAPAPKSDKYVNDPSLSFDENLKAADKWDRMHPPK